MGIMKEVKMNYNERPGRRMRFCETCGAPMGLMTLESYKKRFVDQSGRCPYCHHAAVKPKEEKPERWITITNAKAKYRIVGLRSMVDDGRVSYKLQRSSILLREDELERIANGQRNKTSR